MSKKVLIFGLGFQGRKYVNFFSSQGYTIDGVTKGGGNKNNIIGLNHIFKSKYFLKEKNLCFDYEIIILSISPQKEQNKTIQFFLDIEYKEKIIIEKPVSYSLELLNKLSNRDNFYFFIDEIILHTQYKKIFLHDMMQMLSIQIYGIKKDDHTNILEHVYAPFLLFENFEDFLSIASITVNELKTIKENLYYKIIYNNKYELCCEKGDFSLNKQIFYRMHFENGLEYIIGLKQEENLMYKKNFYKLREYLNTLSF